MGLVWTTWRSRIAYMTLLSGATMAVVAGNWFAGTLEPGPGDHHGRGHAGHHMPPSAFAFPELQGDAPGAALVQRLPGGIRIARPTPREDIVIGRYQARASMRPFVLEALGEKARGSVAYSAAYYALAAVNECSSLLGQNNAQAAQPAFDTGMPDLEFQRRSEAWAYYQVRCADFSPAELKELTNQLADKLRRSGLKASLPAAAAAPGDAASFEDRVVDGLTSAMRDALRYLTPGLLDTVGWENLLPPQVDDGGARFVYKGRAHREHDDPAFFDALGLLPCGLGLKCTPTEGEVGTKCAAGDGCDADRFDAVRRKASATPGQYEQTLDYYQQMVTSINTGCTDDFKP